MNWMQRVNKVLVFAGLSLPLVALVVMSWMVHRTTGQVQQSFYQVAHTYKMLNLVQQTQLHLLDAEAERREYLLTGGEDYFTSYGRSMSSIRNNIDQLLGLSRENPGQQSNIVTLQGLIIKRLQIDPARVSGSGVALRDSQRTDLVNDDRSTLEAIGRTLFRMGQEEDYALGLSQQRAEDDAMQNQLTSVILLGAVAMVLIFIFIILLRLERLQHVVTICAWTGQVKHEGQWIRLDDYLQQRFGLSVSHGLSREAADRMAAEFKDLKRPGNPPRN